MSGFRQIEICGYIEVWLALENHLLDSVLGPLHNPHHTRVQRRSLGKAPEIVEHPLAQIGFPFVHPFDSGKPLHLDLALREHAESDIVQVRRQHAPKILELLQSGGEIQLLGLLRRCGQDEQANEDTNDVHGSHSCTPSHRPPSTAITV